MCIIVESVYHISQKHLSGFQVVLLVQTQMATDWAWLARLASSIDPGRPAKQCHSSGFSLIYRPFIMPQEFIVLSLT